MVLIQFLTFTITLILLSKNFSWKSSHTNLSKWNQDRLQARIIISRNNEFIRRAKKDVVKDKDGKDVAKLESVEVVLAHYNLVNNSYQKASKILFTFAPNEELGQFITVSPHLLTMLNTTSAEFQSIELWFTDQNNRPLEIENSVNITLIIG